MNMTETKTLGARESWVLLEQVVEEFGYDYVDPGSQTEGAGCDYTRYDENKEDYVCGCIVGQVLHKFGVEVEDLRKLWGSIGLLEDEVKSLFDIELTVGARLVLRAAQRVQDKGNTWGDALHAAEDTYRILRRGEID